MSTSLPIRGAWIEIGHFCEVLAQYLSLPIRGAWIEMRSLATPVRHVFVAPHPGSVD